ncbi:hypothetical protein Dsin_022072 [Dipteronia sinensis]|uniref:RNase H type-1 domain-containing protein n=1 Tax=Dipteronia sinensis TaxID=43782 RepID=A0AAE0E0T6_9ROSI|nr:hypothetical protein Dsin_022072 [Dipteronia sinensis]
MVKGVRWRVGDGKSILVYNDYWLPKAPCVKVCSPRCLPDGVIVANLFKRQGKWCEEVAGLGGPLLGCYKMNVDAALAKEKSGAGLVCRNDNRVVIGATALVFDYMVSVEVAEARTVLEGLLLTVNNGWMTLCIKSDAFGVVNWCT